MTPDPFTEAEHITIPRPHVPYGPEGIPAEQADADYLREAARKLEEHYKPFGSNLRATVVKLVRDAADAVEAPRTHLAAQEESVLMTSREETISDRLSDAGYTEYAEDEDGGVTWVSAPLGEVLRIVSAAQEPTDAEVEAAARALDLEGAVYAFNGDRTAAETDVAARPLRMDSARGEELQIKARAALSAARAARRDEEKR